MVLQKFLLLLMLLLDLPTAVPIAQKSDFRLKNAPNQMTTRFWCCFYGWMR